MKNETRRITIAASETREDFNLGAAITVILLMMLFIGVNFYVLIASYMDIR